MEVENGDYKGIYWHTQNAKLIHEFILNIVQEALVYGQVDYDMVTPNVTKFLDGKTEPYWSCLRNPR